MLFMGEYNHTLDTKGRVIVPAKFRELLGETFVVTKGLDGCLYVYPNSEWESYVEKLNALPMAKKESRTFKRFFMSGAAEVECDKQGRILLPNSLREFAGLEKDIVFIGVGNRAEIWSTAAWEDTSDFNDVDSIAESLDELGISI